MPPDNSTFDVFIAYNHRDLKHAIQAAELLRSYGLAVFVDSQGIPAGARTEDAVWQAMAESHAVVAIVPEDAPASWMAFELGAAKAWNKPLYAVATTSSIGRPPVALRHVSILPLSRLDEIARSILDSREPMSDEDQRHLSEAYRRTGVSVDQLALQPQQLATLVKDFNRRARRHLSGEQVMWLLLRLRKQRALPALSKRATKAAS
jgi:TIR domain